MGPPVEIEEQGGAGLRSRPRFWRDSRRRRLLALADVAAAVAASVAVVSSAPNVFWAMVVLPAWVLVAKLLGLYDRDHVAIRHLTIDELPALAAWAGIGVGGLALYLPLTPSGPVDVSEAIAGFAAAFVGVFAFRGIARWAWRRSTPREVTAVLGDGTLAQMIRRKLVLFPSMHLELVDRPADEDFELAIESVDRLIVASERMEAAMIADVVRRCRERQVKLSVISPLRGREGPVRLGRVADLPVLEYETWDPSRSTVLIKRSFDLAVAGAGLLLTLPLWPLIAIAIKLDSRGPVFFSQKRAGLDGEPFRMYKFRTMVESAHDQLEDVVRLDELPEPMYKLARDPRITRVGRVLRRLSLDELPQLWNVLRGDMSIVGPRPEMVEVVELYQPEHRFRLTVKPGITGPMQVFGRGDLTFNERLAVELDYIENLSLARDLRILAETLPVALRGTGAY